MDNQRPKPANPRLQNNQPGQDNLSSAIKPKVSGAGPAARSRGATGFDFVQQQDSSNKGKKTFDMNKAVEELDDIKSKLGSSRPSNPKAGGLYLNSTSTLNVARTPSGAFASSPRETIKSAVFDSAMYSNQKAMHETGNSQIKTQMMGAQYRSNQDRASNSSKASPNTWSSNKKDVSVDESEGVQLEEWVHEEGFLEKNSELTNSMVMDSTPVMAQPDNRRKGLESILTHKNTNPNSQNVIPSHESSTKNLYIPDSQSLNTSNIDFKLRKTSNVDLRMKNMQDDIEKTWSSLISKLNQFSIEVGEELDTEVLVQEYSYILDKIKQHL